MDMDENMILNSKEFVAFSRKLLRELIQINNAIENDEKEKALEMLKDLIYDTECDIQA
ncbi:MAG: hypothetical protein PUE95_11100 [Lachnospiraceae bacterium]|nr:hypothetical protein [Lachnospiraceae bacterium]